MNNFVIGLKRFFTNKNVVTVIMVIVILVVLYFGYSSSIKKQTNPVNVPVAAKEIAPQTQITQEDVTYKQVAGSMLDTGVIRSSALVVGKYTKVNVTIPAGSVFYSDWVANAEEIPGNWIEQLDYENGELGYYMDVNIESTLGNSVLPDSYIDIYMKAIDEDGKIMFGKLMKNVKVLVVHDGNGNNVFSSTSGNVSPEKIGFAVNHDMYNLLWRISYLGNKIDLILAPRGVTVPTEDYIIVTSATLRDYVDAQTTIIEEDVIADEEIDEPTQEGTQNQTQQNQNNPVVQ